MMFDSTRTILLALAWAPFAVAVFVLMLALLPLAFVSMLLEVSWHSARVLVAQMLTGNPWERRFRS